MNRAGGRQDLFKTAKQHRLAIEARSPPTWRPVMLVRECIILGLTTAMHAYRRSLVLDGSSGSFLMQGSARTGVQTRSMPALGGDHSPAAAGRGFQPSPGSSSRLFSPSPGSSRLTSHSEDQSDKGMAAEYWPLELYEEGDEGAHGEEASRFSENKPHQPPPLRAVSAYPALRSPGGSSDGSMRSSAHSSMRDSPLHRSSSATSVGSSTSTTADQHWAQWEEMIQSSRDQRIAISPGPPSSPEHSGAFTATLSYHSEMGPYDDNDDIVPRLRRCSSHVAAL